MGRAKIYSDKDTEIPDDAYDFAFWGAGQDEADIVYMLPSNPDDAIKSKVTEIMHHLHGASKGGYK
jgi:CobQ-like glutamine amidotransferase family enzyme